MQDTQNVLVIGSRLLAILAVASVAVLVGGRMADQTRRVGLLKAVGGTPRLVAAVLLTEYLVLALLAAAGGLVAGWLAAPLLTDPGAGLLGSAGAPSLTLSTVAQVTAVALGVAAIATFVPAVRAARTSTVHALADTARPPRRTPWLIAISARLPVPLLLGLRVAARRPRRVVLSTISIFVTVTGVVAVLAAKTLVDQDAQLVGGTDPSTVRANQVLLVITVTLVALAAVNAIFVTWATALDAKHSSALSRALGATPQQVSTGLSVAQVLPAARRRRPGNRRRPRTLQRRGWRRGRGDGPAGLADARRGAGHRARGGGADDHPRPTRRPPSCRRDPPSGAGLTRDAPSRVPTGRR